MIDCFFISLSVYKNFFSVLFSCHLTRALCVLEIHFNDFLHISTCVSVCSYIYLFLLLPAGRFYEFLEIVFSLHFFTIRSFILHMSVIYIILRNQKIEIFLPSLFYLFIIIIFLFF